MSQDRKSAPPRRKWRNTRGPFDGAMQIIKRQGCVIQDWQRLIKLRKNAMMVIHGNFSHRLNSLRGGRYLKGEASDIWLHFDIFVAASRPVNRDGWPCFHWLLRGTDDGPG